MEQTSSKKIWIAAIGIILVLTVLLIGSSYNSLVSSNENVNGKWAQIDTQLARRYDLIPNLVETVKGISNQEKAVFTAIADARSHYAGATTPEARVGAANEVESSLARLLVITENYPVLTSSVSYQNLMVQLEGTENRIAVARKDYNDAVQSFDGKIKTFPTNLLAGMFGFQARTYFEATNDTRTNPKVNFSN